ncbi:hypothetical protein [Rhodospirillum sp. A1_3_36]|uniref:hypothetical protein n=1 Tax=Rhodospirillum sp. A1_3_36 TaxID=3391666 RepID=UPI0039A6911F
MPSSRPKALVTIPHYYRPTGTETGHASLNPTRREERLRNLEACLFHLAALFGDRGRYGARHDTATVHPAANPLAVDLDIVVNTTGGHHLLDDLSIPPDWYEHREVPLEDPLFLGFAAQEVLRDRSGGYDWYIYLEDDLILQDAFFLAKLAQVNRLFEAHPLAERPRLLLPHRWEDPLGRDRERKSVFTKCYPDWRLSEHSIFPGQPIAFDHLGMTVTLEPAVGPHAGCFFLNAAQMARLATHPLFLDTREIWITPLDSAATKAIANAFALFKPSLDSAPFFELRHASPLTLDQLFDQGPGQPPLWKF